jgi:hypothetical protein
MPLSRAHEPTEPPTALHERAMDDLRFIRQTMARAHTFTAVPGWGNVVMGLLALGAAWVASHQTTHGAWLKVWMVTAILGFLTGAGALALKAWRANAPLSSGPGRTMVLSFIPPLAVAAAMTAGLRAVGAISLLPGLWHLSYGAAIVAGGTFSIRTVPLMGIAFMVVGGLALVTPSSWGDIWMAAGFGGLHIIFGILIARRHGG